MRAPNKPRRKRSQEPSLFPAFSLFLIASLFFSALFYSMSPVSANEEKKLSIILIDGGEVYVRSGSYYNFPQGYQLYVKGTDTDGKRIWLELCREGTTLKDDIVTEGSQFVYSRNSTEILNLTVSTIYAGADGVLVRFSPVYQQLDPKLPKPQTSNGSIPDSPSDNENIQSEDPRIQAGGFNMPLLLLSLGALLLVTGLFAGKGHR